MNRFPKALFVCLTALWLFPAVVMAQCPAGNVLYVNASAMGANNGTSWDDAFTDLQDALSSTCTGITQIWVAAGTYYPDQGGGQTNDDRNATFQLKDGVAIYGGFPNTGDPGMAERDWVANQTILSGDLLQNDGPDFANNGDNSYSVVTGSGTNATAEMDGFTITGGNADVTSGLSTNPNRSGGGMYNSSGSPTVTNCTFSGNSATNNGGGMYNLSSSPTVTNCTFSGNTAFSGGGMVNLTSSSPTVTNCTFSGNSALSRGGGMYNRNNSSPTVTNCTFSGNSAIRGGGMYNFVNSNPEITNSTFTANTATFNGGGMFNSGSSPTVTNSTFTGNEATINGGGMFNNTSSPTVTNCTFTGNSANLNGGGMFNFVNSNPEITNSTFTANTATDNGGGMFNSNTSSPTVTNCIIWNNTAGGSNPAASASVFNSDAGSNPTFNHSLIANSGGSGTGWDTDIGTDGGNNIAIDPLFVAPLAPGLNTGGDYRLQACSPAINAGDNMANTTTTDLDDNPRIEDGIIDMGAYELQSLPLSGTTLYVNASAMGANNGTSWDDAFTDLQDALNSTCPGITEIWVAAGTYYPDQGGGQTNDDRNATFQLKNGVAIYGGFPNTGDPGMAERDWLANQTILSGDINQSGNLTGNSYSVVTGSGTNATAEMDGFTITGGNADVTSESVFNPNRSGGGMYNSSGSPTVTNCTFSGNSTTAFGGGMFNQSSSPTVTNCTFSGNTANSFGGGMYNRENSSPTVTNCTFSGNSASEGGGGMYNGFGSPTVTSCTFSGNSANVGGGMYNRTSSPTVTNSTFSGNSATNNGGGMYNIFSSSPTVTNCIIWNNSAVGFTNTASASVFNFNSTPKFSYSLIANSGGSGSWVVAFGTDSGNNIDVDPLFVASLAPGLNTGGDYRLPVCSPAINVGDNTANSTTTDLDGNPRIEDGIIDMGAYEFQGTSSCITLSGNIVWEHDRVANPIGVANVAVELSGDDSGSENTDANGDYAIPTTGGSSLTLTPTKTGGEYDGVDVADVTRIQQHVTFIDRLDDSYKVIAADVNQSNSVTGLDAAVIFHAINGNPSAQTIFETPSWRFVEAAHTFMDENEPWNPAFPEDISLMNVMADVVNQSFVGVKMGDVNGTWATPPLLLAPVLNWAIPDAALKAGQTLRVPFRANGLPDVAAWQFALRFDTDYLRFERALPTAAFPLKDENFGAWQAGRGELRSVFAVPQGLELPKDEIIFELEFQVVYDGLRLSEVLSLDNGILDGRVYDTALNGGAVALSFERDSKLPSVELPGEAALGFALEQNIPNPFSNETLVRFELPEAGEAVFSVHDVQGRLLYEQRGFLDAGLHEVRLDAARLGATGVLSYTLRAGAHSATRRMVLVR